MRGRSEEKKIPHKKKREAERGRERDVQLELSQQREAELGVDRLGRLHSGQHRVVVEGACHLAEGPSVQHSVGVDVPHQLRARGDEGVAPIHAARLASAGPVPGPAVQPRARPLQLGHHCARVVAAVVVQHNHLHPMLRVLRVVQGADDAWQHARFVTRGNENGYEGKLLPGDADVRVVIKVQLCLGVVIKVELCLGVIAAR